MSSKLLEGLTKTVSDRSVFSLSLENRERPFELVSAWGGEGEIVAEEPAV